MGRLLAEADVTAPVAILVESPPTDEKVKDLCEVYLSAIERAERGEKTISIDDRELSPRTEVSQPMRPGKRERREFEYIRHGTQTLIASVMSLRVR